MTFWPSIFRSFLTWLLCRSRFNRHTAAKKVDPRQYILQWKLTTKWFDQKMLNRFEKLKPRWGFLPPDIQFLVEIHYGWHCFKFSEEAEPTAASDKYPNSKEDRFGICCTQCYFSICFNELFSDTQMKGYYCTFQMITNLWFTTSISALCMEMDHCVLVKLAHTWQCGSIKVAYYICSWTFVFEIFFLRCGIMCIGWLWRSAYVPLLSSAPASIHRAAVAAELRSRD